MAMPETKYILEEWEPRLVGGANWFGLTDDRGLPWQTENEDKAYEQWVRVLSQGRYVRLVKVTREVLKEKS